MHLSTITTLHHQEKVAVGLDLIEGDQILGEYALNWTEVDFCMMSEQFEEVVHLFFFLNVVCCNGEDRGDTIDGALNELESHIN